MADRRFARGLVHRLEAVLMLRQAQQVLGLMCGQCSLSAIYRFGDTHPELLAGLGLRRSPSVATLSRLMRTVKVSEVRQAMLSFTVALSELRGVELTVASVDGKTMGGVWEDREQLRLWHVFSRQGALALDQSHLGTSGGTTGRPGMDGAGFGQRFGVAGTDRRQPVRRR